MPEANNFGETFELDEDLGEMSFSEFDKKSKNQSSVKHKTIPAFEKTSSLGQFEKNPFSKKQDILSLAESFKMDSLNQSRRTHSHAFLIEGDIFDDEIKLKELLEKETLLMEVINKYENQQYEEALEGFKDLLQHFKHHQDHKKISILECYISEIYLDLQRPHDSLEHIHESKEAYTRLVGEQNEEDYSLHVRITFALGRYFFSVKNFEHALEQFVECYETSKQHLEKGPQEMFKMITYIGECEVLTRSLKEALESFHCAETIITKHKDSFNPKEKFNSFRRLADTYKSIEDFSKSIHFYKKAVEVSETGRSGFSNGEMAVVHSSLGACFSATSDFDLAVKCYQISIDLLDTLKDKKSHIEISRCYFNMGQAYLKVYRCYLSQTESKMRLRVLI